MARKYFKYILPGVAVIIAVTIGVAYSIWNKPHPDIKESAAIPASAPALYESLSANDATAKEKFVNKVVAVTGKVKQVLKNQQEQQVILLQTNSEAASINCTMAEAIKEIEPGGMLTLKGMCMGYSGGDALMEMPGDVFLTKCIQFKK